MMDSAIGINTSQQFEQASIYSDLNSLDSIRKMALTDKESALKKAAKEFEAFFLNMMLKSMRQASQVIGDDSPMSSPQEKMYTSMLDEQLSVDLSQNGLLGIADLMTKQLSNNVSKPETNHMASKISRLEFTQKTNKASSVVPDKELKSVIKLEKDLVEDKKELNDSQVVAENNLKAEKKSLFDNTKDFVKTLLPYAKKAANLLGLDPKLLIAQAALETGWGKFIMHDESGKPGFNLFGIKSHKSWQGEEIKIDTLEVENQSFKKVKANFRKYSDFSQSFDDYVEFVKANPRYEKALNVTHDANQYMKELQSAGYATDPNYADKVLRIFRQQLSEMDY